MKNARLAPYFILLLPPLFWAGNAVIGRAMAQEISPLTLSLWRWIGALVLLLPFGLKPLWRQRRQAIRHWKLLAVLGLTSVTAYNTLLYVALQTTTAINATLVSSSMPMLIVALSWLWLGEKLSLLQWFGVGCSVLGVLTVIANGDPLQLVSLTLRPGDLIVLLAVMAWAVYSVLLRRNPPGLDALALLTAQIIFGLVLLLPFAWADLASGAAFELGSDALWAIAYVAIFPSIIAYLAWNKGVFALGANLAGQYIYLIPIFTAVLATLLLGEAFRWYHALGLALIAGGVWITSFLGPKLARRRLS